MSILSINGLPLDIVHTRYFARKVRLDVAGNYLWTDFFLDCDFTFNARATSYSGGVASAPPVFPGRIFGSSPAETDAALRHHLAQPRKQILYAAGDLARAGPVIFESPISGDPCDVAGGPVVEALDVTQLHGDKTWAGSIRLRAAMNECVRKTGRKPFVLSHVWWKTQDVDQDHFSQTVTHGQVVFNLAELRREGVYPDDFRREFFHPIDNGSRRESISIAPAADMGSLSYRFVDREVPFSIGSRSPMTRIEAYQTFWWTKGTFIAGAAASMGGIGVGGLFGIARGGTSAPAMAGGHILGAVDAGLRSMTPRFRSAVVVRSWGNKNTTRFDMTKKALALCFARIGPIDEGTSQSELLISHELSGKCVEINYSRSVGMEALAGMAAGVIPDWATLVIDKFELMENIEEARLRGMPAGGIGDGEVSLDPDLRRTPTSDDLIFTARASYANPRPPGSFGARGTVLVRLVHSALTEACAVPVSPTNIIAPLTMTYPERYDRAWS